MPTSNPQCTPDTCTFARLYVEVQAVLDDILGPDVTDNMAGGMADHVRTALQLGLGRADRQADREAG